MKSKKIVILSFFTLLFLSFKVSGQGNLFFTVVKQAEMDFNKPINTIETTVIKNDELNYQYALKDTLNGIEIRYLVYPLQGLVKKYNGPHADTGIGMIDPNFLHTNLLLVYYFKVQGKPMDMSGTMPDIKELSHATADLEYNADWGAEVDLEPCDEFAQKYKYCTMFEIHKDNVADAFVIYLYDDKDRFEDAVKPEFHSLVFKK